MKRDTRTMGSARGDEMVDLVTCWHDDCPLTIPHDLERPYCPEHAQLHTPTAEALDILRMIADLRTDKAFVYGPGPGPLPLDPVAARTILNSLAALQGNARAVLRRM